MTLISIITLLVSIMLLIALYEDYNCYCLTGKHLYDQEKLEKRGKILFWVAVCNLILALLNLFYTFLK